MTDPVQYGGRRSGKTIGRTSQALIDAVRLSLDVGVVVYVSPNMRLARYAFDLCQHLAPPDRADRTSLRLFYGGSHMRFESMLTDVERCFGLRGRVVIDHACRTYAVSSFDFQKWYAWQGFSDRLDRVNARQPGKQG